MKIYAKVHYLLVVSRKFVLSNRSKVKKLFAGFITLITILSIIPLFSEKWKDVLYSKMQYAASKFPDFISFFFDPRALIIYGVVLLIWLAMVYYKYEVNFLRLAIMKKKEIAEDLPKILKSVPPDHYLGLILGKLNAKALEVKNLYGAEIISAIDKNIKKYERVFWISEDEIGIIFWEKNAKDESYFLNAVVRGKVTIVTDEIAASIFLNNVQFTMTKINNNDDLHLIESRARIQLLNDQKAASEE